MGEWIIAVVIATFSLMGAVLRFAPFRRNAAAREKRLVMFWTILLTLGYVGVLVMILRQQGVQAIAPCLQVGGNVMALVMSLPLFLVLRRNYRVHIFLLGVVATLQFLLLSIPAFVISFDLGLPPEGELSVMLGVYALILAATYYPMRKLMIYTVEPFLHMEADSYWNTVCFVPVAFFFAIIFIVWAMESVVSLHQLISSLFSCAMILFLCISIAADQKRIQEQRNMEQQLFVQKNHYAELRARVEDARKTRHDLKHHIAAVLRYIELDDKSGLQRYCDDLSTSMDAGLIPYTGNNAADGVIYHYIRRCQQEKVEFSYSGIIRSSGISDMDLCVLLGNALDNALAGCLTVPENRKIQLICQSEQQMLSILVRNTFDGKITQIGEELQSRKREGRIGVGMRSMKTVSSRYGGAMEVTWDENTFTVVILLPITTEQSQEETQED